MSLKDTLLRMIRPDEPQPKVTLDKRMEAARRRIDREISFYREQERLRRLGNRR